MADDQKPLFFGGLPTRGQPTPPEQPVKTVDELTEPAGQQPSWSKIRKWVVLGVISVCALAGIVVGILAAFPSLTETPAAPLQIAPGVLESEQTVAEEETAAAENIVAEGGAAVTGHAVSADFCAKLNSFVSVRPDGITSTSVTEVALAAIEDLAAAESPNQAAYKGFLDLVKDPASATSTEASTALSASFAKAAEADIVTCL